LKFLAFHSLRHSFILSGSLVLIASLSTFSLSKGI
jgi:hypothetical protein